MNKDEHIHACEQVYDCNHAWIGWDLMSWRWSYPCVSGRQQGTNKARVIRRWGSLRSSKSRDLYTKWLIDGGGWLEEVGEILPFVCLSRHRKMSSLFQHQNHRGISLVSYSTSPIVSCPVRLIVSRTVYPVYLVLFALWHLVFSHFILLALPRLFLFLLSYFHALS